MINLQLIYLNKSLRINSNKFLIILIYHYRFSDANKRRNRLYSRYKKKE